jgi:hypothetical protein
MALSLATVLAAPPPEAVGAVVRRCVDAYGGKAALARATAARQEGSVTSTMSPGQAGRMVRTFARPGKLRVEIAFPGGRSETRIVDGARGWRDGEEVRRERLSAMILQAARLDLPALLESSEARLEDRGSSDVGGTPVRVLALPLAPGLLLEAAIDARSGRILRSRGASRVDGIPLEFVTAYEDFRKVDGVLVAFREKSWANGRSTGETVLEKVEFPKKVPEATFRP